MPINFASRPFHQLAAVMSTALAVACPGQQRTWIPRQPTHSPSPRFQHAMAYDIVRQRTVLFGGGQSTYLADTWEWDGSDWNLRTPATSPPARNMHSMAYDPVRQRTVLFGGRANSFSELSDTWEWDGVLWTQVFPTTVPAGRVAHGMTYDWTRQRTVMISGRFGNFQLHDDVWEWDGIDWTNVTPTFRPPGRETWVAYDLGRSRTVLFGGGLPSGQLNDTWEWDGQQWYLHAPANAPSTRTAQAIAYDMGASDSVVFGGSGGPTNDTWAWDGTNWTQLQPSASPPARWFHTMVYDVVRERMVMFGGDSGGGLGDTWEFGSFTTADYTTFGQGCGSAPQNWQAPTLTNTGTPVLGQSFNLLLGNGPATVLPVILLLGFSNTNWGPVALPMPLGALAPTCSVLASGESLLFHALPASGSLTVSLQVPFIHGLQGIRFYNQFFVLDPTASTSALIATNAGMGTFGDV